MNASAILLFIAAPAVCVGDPPDTTAGGQEDAYAILNEIEKRRGDHEAAARSGQVEGHRLTLVTRSPEGFAARSTVVEKILPTLLKMRAGRGGLNELNDRTNELIAEHISDPDEVLGQWQSFSLIYSADDVAVRTSGYLPPQLRVWTRGEEHLYDRNSTGTWGQVSLFSERRGVWMETPERFLFLPDKRKVPRLEVTNSEGTRTLTNGYYTLEIDDRMRILRETMVLASGRYYADRFQQDFRTVPLGDRDFSLPHAIGTVGYSRAVPDDALPGGAEPAQGVRRIQVHLVRDAEFGVDVSPEEFRIAAPAGTNIADFRNAEVIGGKRRPQVYQLREGVADAVEFFEHGRFQPRHAPGRRGRP